VRLEYISGQGTVQKLGKARISDGILTRRTPRPLKRMCSKAADRGGRSGGVCESGSSVGIRGHGGRVKATETRTGAVGSLGAPDALFRWRLGERDRGTGVLYVGGVVCPSQFVKQKVSTGSWRISRIKRVTPKHSGSLAEVWEIHLQPLGLAGNRYDSGDWGQRETSSPKSSGDSKC